MLFTAFKTLSHDDASFWINLIENPAMWPMRGCKFDLGIPIRQDTFIDNVFRVTCEPGAIGVIGIQPHLATIHGLKRFVPILG